MLTRLAIAAIAMADPGGGAHPPRNRPRSPCPTDHPAQGGRPVPSLAQSSDACGDGLPRRDDRLALGWPRLVALLHPGNQSILRSGSGRLPLGRLPARADDPAGACAGFRAHRRPLHGRRLRPRRMGQLSTRSRQCPPTWTKPHDVVSSRAIAHDHHVALRDAHVSGAATGRRR